MEPVTVEKVPAAHSVHRPLPSESLKLPASQGRQVALEFAPRLLLAVPLGQAWEVLSASVAVQNRPAGHSPQEKVIDGKTRPAPHLMSPVAVDSSKKMSRPPALVREGGAIEGGEEGGGAAAVGRGRSRERAEQRRP